MSRLRKAVALTAVTVAAVSTAIVPTGARASSPVLPRSIVVSAHRGGSAYAPEDTMYAYRNAVRIGADQMETDSWLTADGVLVLIHDQTLDRTTSCTGDVTSYTFTDLERCDAGWWWTPGQSTTTPVADAPHPLRGLGIKVPAAKELFAFVSSLGPNDTHTINIEIKDANFLNPTRALVDLIEASGLKSRTIVQSFYPPALDYVKQLDPAIKTALLTAGSTTPYLAWSMPDGHDWISPSNSDVDLNATTVDAAHAAGKKVIPWTPDTRADLIAMGELGVDALITNYPACLLAMEGRPFPRQLLPAASVKRHAGSVSLCGT